MEDQESKIISNNINSNPNSYNINEIREEKNEFQKMSEYYSKISEYRDNSYKNCLFKNSFCDCLLKGDWVVGYIVEKDDYGITVNNLNEYYEMKNSQKYQLSYLDNKIAYFRKYTKPSSVNIIPQRENKNLLNNRIKMILNEDKKNMFKDDKNENPKIIYEYYYYLHSTIYKAFDYSISRSKDDSGVKEGFRIIILILEILAEFYNFINNNYEEFLNYRNNILNSELEDLVLFNVKYAIFSFWDEAALLMQKIFLRNPYYSWFIDYEKKLQKIIPSSPNMKKINSKDKLLCPLYENQITSFKFKNYSYNTRNGEEIKLKKICIEDAYKNKNIEYNNLKYQAYILAYFIDYFYSLGGYKSLFKLCTQISDIKISSQIFEMIFYASPLTNNFRGFFEDEKNGISKILLDFMNSITFETLVTNKKSEIIHFLKKGCMVYNENTTFMFEEFYIKYILKNIILENNFDNKIQSLNELNIILNSIEYNLLLKENKLNTSEKPEEYTKKSSKENKIKNEKAEENNKKLEELNQKFPRRDKNIKEMDLHHFSMNCKNNELIESLFKDKDINMEILTKLAPIIYTMYKNNFGFIPKEANEDKVKNIKKLVFDTLLNKLRGTEKDFKNFNQLNTIFCDFCEILTDEDKYYIFSEIKTIIFNLIFNQSTYLKEILNFIINFSSIAVKKTNTYNNEDNKDKKENKKDSKIQKEEMNVDINNFSFDEKLYYGLELIYSYLSFEQYNQLNITEQQKIEFVNTASEGVINITSNLKSSKFALNVILNKIYDSIKNQKDVLQHLLLLIKLLNYSKFDNFSITFNQYFGEYLQKVELIIIVIDELHAFLDNLAQFQIDEISNENDINANINNINDKDINIQNAYLNENYNIKVRIKTVINLILKYKKVKFDYNKIQAFFIKVSKFNEFTKNTLYEYILKYVVNFSKEFLMFLYNNIILNKEIFIVYNFTTYQICKNIIIQINKKDNHLFIMNNKDVGLLINKTDVESVIIGIDLIWDILLNDEQKTDINIINDLTNFLCNMYFGTRIKSNANIYKSYEEFWNLVINKIVDRLEKLLVDKEKNAKGIKSIILLIKKIIIRTNNENGEIIKDLNDILKESTNLNSKKQSKDYTFIGNKLGGENFFMTDININSGDYFYILRYKLSNNYNMPINNIGITVYLNNLGKTKKIAQVEMDKIYKNRPIKEFNSLNDFDNIYEQLNALYEWSNSGKKKYPFIIEVKLIKRNVLDIIKTNPLDLIYKNSKLPIMFMNLLREKNSPYSLDVLYLTRGKNNDENSQMLFTEIETTIKENKDEKNIFNFEDASIYYISYMISNLYKVIKKNFNINFIDKFLKSNIWNINIKDLNIINDDSYFIDPKLPLLRELYEKFNLINNLVNIYIIVVENLFGNNKEILIFIYRIIEIYKFIINESMRINLSKCGKSEGVSIKDIKELYDKSLSNISNWIINNSKVLRFIINSLNNVDSKNEEMVKIKNDFEYIIFESVLKNSYKPNNKRIKSFILDLIKKLVSNDNLENERKSLFNYLLEFYLSQKCFDKMNYFLKEINDTKININNLKYERNIKTIFDIISGVLSNTYDFIKDLFSLNDYINKLILPKIYNIYIPNLSQNSIFHQLILGGVLKLFLTILLMPNNNFYDISYEKNKDFINYLFNTIIMPKCDDNSLTLESLNKENNMMTITSSFCIKNASNLFFFFLFKNDINEEVYNNYIKKLTSFHKLGFWKGNNLSDWKLYYKDHSKSSSFVGLKNLGCTCYINSLIQTFYNMPLLREGILKCENPNFTEKNCLFQLIKVFYSLKFLQTNYYTPTSFIENYDNEKLNVSVQMDVFEFFCDFLDKIEQKLKGSRNENIIKYFFMGRQNDVLKFENGCNHHRKHESQFYSIQLQVHGKKDIYDSLNSLIEGEKMDGANSIFCQECNKKFPAIKSQNFKILPRFFMFVLKRFEYDYKTYKKMKINDYYEFPLILDMNKYTENYLENTGIIEDNIYKLKSIIIHNGNCETGHYYAFILDDKSNEWYEFNDTKVQKFNIEKLDVEAFGKKIEINEEGNKFEIDNEKNAYMLFYEKINKNNCEQFNKIEAINEITGEKSSNINNENNIVENINNVNDYKDEDDDFNLLGDGQSSTEKNKINEVNSNNNNNNELNEKNKLNILESINKETFNYLLKQRLFSGEYHHFILSLFLNVYKRYINKDFTFSEKLCSNNNFDIIPNEIKNFKKDRKTEESSNLEKYLSKKKIYVFDSDKKINNINEINSDNISKDQEDKILELFKNIIIYFFNVMIRAREKDYLGGTVDLIKYFINNYLFCADYLIEEFSSKNLLIEYMINCPLYEIKKLVVGIIYCAMIKCVTSYEKKMREEMLQNLNNQINTETNKKNAKKQKKSSNKNVQSETKEKEKTVPTKTEQEMSDEELARKLQEEENLGYSSNNYENNNYNKKNSNSKQDSEINSNPLDRKFIPVNVLKLIYNTFHIIRKIKFGNMNEARFLYLIIYRFSLISKKTKKFLINKAYALEFLNILLLPKIKEKQHDDTKILNTLDKGEFQSTHEILNLSNKKVQGIYDKGGAFHYENYINLLYFFLLSYNLKSSSKHPYFEDSYNFENKKFIKSLFFQIFTKQDAYAFTQLICSKCNNIKHYKKRIEQIINNIIGILEKADNNDKINYDINTNRDNYNKGAYSENYSYSNIDYEKDFPKINPKYVLLMFKRFITKPAENQKIDDYRINSSLKQFFNLIEKNMKYYNYTIMLIDFVCELFINNRTIMDNYINQYSKNLKDLIQWLKDHPISPELYRIEGIIMYKDDNVAYNENITEEEKMIFNEKQTEKTEKKIQKLNNILDLKINEYDYDYEADFDLTDFKFRKGDFIFYNKNKAIIKEFLDELILIKIIENDKDENISDSKNTIADLEKIKFWVAKDDKNISIYSLE